ncbi:hypothetical protein VB779_08725 [Haloarculaceae archaeon H-GB11]|nr:hypothetical protein [Haloarculaceae archaeon H-GB11]
MPQIDLWRLRTALFPAGERLLPRLRWTGPTFEQEFVGVLDEPPADIRDQLRAMGDVYPCNAAKAKYHGVDGERVYAVGSYAYRPEGFFGQSQTHIRLFPHVDGTALICHWETSPWHDPVGHYGNADGEWDAEKGVAIARDLLDVDTDASIAGIGNYRPADVTD